MVKIANIYYLQCAGHCSNDFDVSSFSVENNPVGVKYYSDSHFTRRQHGGVGGGQGDCAEVL